MVFYDFKFESRNWNFVQTFEKARLKYAWVFFIQLNFTKVDCVELAACLNVIEVFN